MATDREKWKRHKTGESEGTVYEALVHTRQKHTVAT